MLRLLLISLAAAALATAAEIRIFASPPLPVPNLAHNVAMEQGTGNRPTDWTFGTAVPENFETGWVDGGRAGKCLWLKAKTGTMSGYWNQAIPVEPGATYLLKGWYRLAGGKILCYAHASVPLPDKRSAAVDERCYRGSLRGHWLVPVFLPPDALAGPDPQQWYPFALKVAVPAPMRVITLSLGMYFTPGEVWFDDVWAGVAVTDLQVKVNAGPGEALRQVVVRAVGAAAPVFDSKPLAAGTTAFETTLNAQPSDGDYEVEVTRADGTVLRQRYPDVAKEVK